MPPFPSLGAWWTTHLQLPGYDPIATAGPCHFDLRAAEQALVVCTQTLSSPLSPWEEAIVLNLWGWRQADGGGGMPRSTPSPTARMPWSPGAPPWACCCCAQPPHAG